MRVVCLSCFDEAKSNDHGAIEKVRQWVEGLKEPFDGRFISIGNGARLFRALSDRTELNDVDVLILAAHGYSDGDFQMCDGGHAAASEVVRALKTGALREKAVLFVFACNGARSQELLSLFPSDGRGPRMVFGATRLALSNPMKNAIKRVAAALAGGKLDIECAKLIVDSEKACRTDGATDKPTLPEEPFLCVIWGPNERYAPG